MIPLLKSKEYKKLKSKQGVNDDEPIVLPPGSFPVD
jgi:hypothetical protein